MSREATSSTKPAISSRRNSKTKSSSAIFKVLEEKIPKHIPDLYPQARTIKRHFTLHVGPTNSGKTYAAMEHMRKIGAGIYLAPLRLLAYEQYEQLNRDGFPCRLLTGEECIEEAGAKMQASTVEMLDESRSYDCVVIDEAQMIVDRDRGGAWTNAILGAFSPEIHVCLAPQALNLVERLIEDCGDTYVVVEHQRFGPLTYDMKNPISSLSAVKKGDAVIVFSRRNVHAVAAELQRKGKKCSIIYGNLPYTVRHTEAEKFSSGENDIVVSTDAIGMGLNLPIRRVVFLENSKYDGVSVRPLMVDEIQQIAGRAGRKGLYDVGYVCGCCGQSGNKAIRLALNAQPKPLFTAVVSFPESLVSLDGDLSDIIRQWSKTITPGLYSCEDVARDIVLCKELEKITDDKDFIFKAIGITFSERDDMQYSLWYHLISCKLKDTPVHLDEFQLNFSKSPNSSEDLRGLEQAYQQLDLFYHFCRTFGHYDEIEKIDSMRNEISAIIRKYLSVQKLSGRTCKRCGRPLPWNHGFGICEECYQAQRQSYYSYYDDFDFF